LCVLGFKLLSAEKGVCGRIVAGKLPELDEEMAELLDKPCRPPLRRMAFHSGRIDNYIVVSEHLQANKHRDIELDNIDQILHEERGF
jgi:hypothetical protein